MYMYMYRFGLVAFMFFKISSGWTSHDNKIIDPQDQNIKNSFKIKIKTCYLSSETLNRLKARENNRGNLAYFKEYLRKQYSRESNKENLAYFKEYLRKQYRNKNDKENWDLFKESIKKINHSKSQLLKQDNPLIRKKRFKYAGVSNLKLPIKKRALLKK